MTDAWLRGARVWRGLEAIGRRARRLMADSRTLQAIAGTARRLKSAVAGDDPKEQVEPTAPAMANSRLLGGLGRLREPLGRARHTSRLGGLLASARAYARGSFLYRWLTAEPEPDVIVIDLRETLTVGPWLRGLERAIAWLLPAAVSSRLFWLGRRISAGLRRRPLGLLGWVLLGLAVVLVVATGATGRLSESVAVAALVLAGAGAVCTRVDRSLAELRDTRAYRALAAAFAPPEPPDSELDPDPEPESDPESQASTDDSTDHRERTDTVTGTGDSRETTTDRTERSDGSEPGDR